jgi:hypothetical protein
VCVLLHRLQAGPNAVAVGDDQWGVWQALQLLFMLIYLFEMIAKIAVYGIQGYRKFAHMHTHTIYVNTHVRVHICAYWLCVTLAHVQHQAVLPQLFSALQEQIRRFYYHYILFRRHICRLTVTHLIQQDTDPVFLRAHARVRVKCSCPVLGLSS